jgi:AAA+ superfamily predicted ATPase
MNKPKSLYITLSSSDTEIYSPYIKMIITFLINKIKKYYCFNVYNRKSVLFLIDEFQKSTCNPINLSIHNKKYVPFRKLNYENKLNIPFVTSRENLIKECKETLKPDLTKKQWFNIPDEMYMRNEEVMYEPLFTSTIPCEDEIEETYKINNDYDNYDDIKLKNLFKSTDNSSSVNKDFDYERNKNNIEIIFHRDIKHKEMYYTQKNENELKEIFDLFSHNTFNKVIENYKQKNERQGIICIFSGSAGVGKTESVLQLARLIKRNIVKYDATQLTSGYIGIAAEKVKEIFNSYYKVVKNSKNHPILFLNEADSIFSRRIDLSCNANQVSSLDENRTQTILLESLENFNGIMIATTNNIINFDPAFERRFLYRIVFDKPDRSTRMKILKNKLPELKEEEIQYIVNNYNLTGAQIENISRKLDIKKIIKNGISFDDIKNLCKGETDNCFTQIEKHIGFK